MYLRLIEKGANINGISNIGYTALMLAISNEYKRFEIARLLVISGADLNIANNDGLKVYDFANGNKKMVLG